MDSLAMTAEIVDEIGIKLSTPWRKTLGSLAQNSLSIQSFNSPMLSS